MDDLAERHNGWINFRPGIPEDAATDARSSLFGIFSGRGPDPPVCTWTPGVRTRRGFDRASVGIHHGAGPAAVKRLQELGWDVPPGWRRLQDHAKRGLVLTVDPSASHADVLRWLLGAGAALTSLPLTGTWLASVHLAV